MIRKVGAAFLLTVVLCAAGSSAQAVSDVSLAEWAFNIDGSVYTSAAGILPGNVNTAGFNFTTGLGTIVISVTGAGSHTILSYFDHEISQAANTYFNEYGGTIGSPTLGESWEIDEPGWVFGDIYTNVTVVGALDNTNAIPSTSVNDVAMALGRTFFLNSDQIGLLTLSLTALDPPGFMLVQTDPDSDGAVYFGQNLAINQIGDPVIPEPITMAGLVIGVGGLVTYARRRRAA